MKLIVYHGSDKIIESPKHNGGRKFSDFGLGFYATTNIEMAKSQSTRKKDKDAYVNSLKYLNSFKLEDIDKEYYLNEIKFKKDIMKKKMNFIRKKYSNIGKYFDELEESDVFE